MNTKDTAVQISLNFPNIERTDGKPLNLDDKRFILKKAIRTAQNSYPIVTSKERSVLRAIWLAIDSINSMHTLEQFNEAIEVIMAESERS